MRLLRNIWPITKRVFGDWNTHEAPRLGASLAFYTILSLSPLLVLAVAVAGLFFGRSTVIQHLGGQLQGLVGQAGAQALSTTLNSAQKSSSHGVLATALSLLVVAFSASGVCGELRSALNKIWEVDPDSGSGVWSMVRERFFSFGMVLAVAFLLLASLVFSTILAAASGLLGSVVPLPHLLAGMTDLIISLLGITAVFALTFRYVPATKVRWRPALQGGLLTAVLFMLGKYAIGAYIAKAAVGSAYGAAGSVVVVIVWMYYTAQIVFFGAEFTHVIASEPALLEPADARQTDRETHILSASRVPQTRTT
jgi:membrane protein